MNPLSPILAAGDTSGALDSKLASFATKDMVVILSGIGIVVILLLIWAALFRKKHRHHHHHHRQYHPSSSDASDRATASSTSSGDQHHRRRQKYHRRFPTLAETGGLPPKRPIESEAPPPS